MMLDVHYQFRKILKNTDTLVVCGYSFGDKAINTQLVFWNRIGRSLVVVDPRGRSGVAQSARPAVEGLLRDKNQTHFISKRMEEVESHELLEVLKTPQAPISACSFI